MWLWGKQEFADDGLKNGEEQRRKGRLLSQQVKLEAAGLGAVPSRTKTCRMGESRLQKKLGNEKRIQIHSTVFPNALLFKEHIKAQKIK